MSARRSAITLAWLAPLLLAVAGCTGPARLAGTAPPYVELTATPFHAQTENHCGPAALATVLGAAGTDVDPTTLAQEVYLPGREGALQVELVAAARARGYLALQTGSSLADLLAEVAAGHPVLVLQRQGAGPWPAWHYAVVIGYDAARDELLLRSGTEPRLAQRAAVFEATWDRGGHWGLVLLEPGALPARPDPGRYMEAAAALEASGNDAGAAAAYSTAARTWPQSPLPPLGLGNLAAARGDWATAERSYREALAVDPGQAAALNNRAEALARLGCPYAARASLEAGLPRIDPADPLRATLLATLQALGTAGQGTNRDPALCSGYAGR